MARSANRVEWQIVPIAGRIEAHRLTLLANGTPSDKRLTNVYAIQEGDDGPIKIGHAVSVAKRLAAMQGGNSRPLHLLASALLPRRLEKEIHYELDEWRLGRSEWFSPSSEVFAAVRALAAHSLVVATDNPHDSFPLDMGGG